MDDDVRARRRGFPPTATVPDGPARWAVWRQDDNGARFRIAAYADRVAALAHLLRMEAGHAHKQLYWVDGPPGRPSGGACRTVADLLCRVEALADGPSLPGPAAYLTALRALAEPLSGRPGADLDTVAALLTAAAEYSPRGRPPPEPAGRAGFAAFDHAVLRALRALPEDDGPAGTVRLLRAAARRDVPEPDGGLGWPAFACWLFGPPPD